MKRYIYLITAAIIIFTLAGCGSGSSSASASPSASATASPVQSSGQLTEDQVSYASDMVDNMLAGIKDKDYTKFSRDFMDTMKSALTEDKLDQLADMLESKIGDYESRTFGQAANVAQNGINYTVIIYTAKYTKESGSVMITVSFTDNNGVKQIGGLNFNSPNLRS